MSNVVLVIHLLLAIALIGVVLLQRSEGGGLGIGGGGGGGGMAGFLTGTSTKSLLTRTTAILAACFMVTSLLLTWIEGRSDVRQSILDTPVEAPAEPVPEIPEGPTVPVE
jgi:preprotein translocase subunit SecG